MKSFQRVQSKHPDVQMLSDNVAGFLQQLMTCPLLDGRLIEKVTNDGVNYTVINHGLGRSWIGYVVTRDDGSGGGNQPHHLDKPRERQLWLRWTDGFSGDIWVF